MALTSILIFIQQTIIICIDVKTKRLAPYSVNIVQPRLCASNMQRKQAGQIGMQPVILSREDVLRVVDPLTSRRSRHCRPSAVHSERMS